MITVIDGHPLRFAPANALAEIFSEDTSVTIWMADGKPYMLTAALPNYGDNIRIIAVGVFEQTYDQVGPDGTHHGKRLSPRKVAMTLPAAELVPMIVRPNQNQ